MNSLKKIAPYFILIVFFFFVTWPLFTAPYIPTHDGEYHITRFMEFKKILDNGILFPRWAPDFNNGYGIPLFTFQYPFPNYIGSLLMYGHVDAVRAFFMTLAFGYGVALAGCYFFFLKRTTGYIAASITILFGTVPYWFVDLYVRGSVGEVWALAWTWVAFASLSWNIPLLFVFAVGLLIISHNIMALLCLPVLCVFLYLQKKQYFLYVLLGTLLASYFWLPALLEQKFVQGLNMISFSHHFVTLADILIPSWGTGFSGMGITGDRMSLQFGFVPILLLLFVVALVLKRKKAQPEEGFVIVLFLFTAWLMLDISSSVWKVVAPLQLLQYPWRLLSYIVIGTPFLASYAVSKKPKVLVLFAIASIVLTYSYMRPVIYQSRTEEYYKKQFNFTLGTSSVGNSFSTIWSPWKNTAASSEATIIRGTGIITDVQRYPQMSSFTVNANHEVSVQINRLYYPGWIVRLDGATMDTQPDNAGTMTLAVPAGTRRVTVWFGTTALRTIANALSLGTLLILVFILFSL